MLGDHEIDAVLYAGYKYIKTMKREETPATAYLVNILPIIALLGLQVASLSLLQLLPLARFAGAKGPMPRGLRKISGRPLALLQILQWRETPNFRGTAS